MQSEPAFESHTEAPEAREARGRRRKRGNGSSGEGPVFVDNSGRRLKLLRRLGMVLGVGCLAYAAVLGAAFMGWGTSLTPSQLLPFGGNAAGGGPGGGFRPNGGNGNQVVQPDGTAPALRSGSASPSASAGTN